MADRVFPGSGINSFLRYDISETDWGYTKEKDLSAATLKGIVDGAVSAIKLPASISDIPELKVTPSSTVVFPNPSINGLSSIAAGNLMRQEGFKERMTQNEILEQRRRIMANQNRRQLDGFAAASPFRLGTNIPVEKNPTSTTPSTNITMVKNPTSQIIPKLASIGSGSNEAIVIILIFVFAFIIAVIMYGTMKYMNAIEDQTNRFNDTAYSYNNSYYDNGYSNGYGNGYGNGYSNGYGNDQYNNGYKSYGGSESSNSSIPTIDAQDQEMEFFGE